MLKEKLSAVSPLGVDIITVTVNRTGAARRQASLACKEHLDEPEDGYIDGFNFIL